MLQKAGEKEGNPFTGRDSIIRQVDQSISKNRFAAVLAPSGYGRTALLKHLTKRPGYFYIDLRKLSISPESFAVDFIGTFCAAADNSADIRGYQDIGKLKQLKLKKGSSEIIKTIDNELQKIKPDQKLLLKSALSFPESYGAEEKRPITLAINNAEELLKLNNFSQIKDAFKIFFDTIRPNKNSSFILASSAFQVMKSLLKKHSGDVLHLTPLSIEETRQLFGNIAGKTDDRIVREAYELSAGIPLVISRIARRFRGERTGDAQKDIALIRYILISELTDTTSNSFFYCSRLFTASLNRARGEALLKTIVKAVSQNKPLRLTEIARRIYRSGPVTKSLLERLIEVDLIEKKDNTFDFVNPVLKMWCSMMFSDISFSSTPDEKSLKERGLL